MKISKNLLLTMLLIGCLRTAYGQQQLSYTDLIQRLYDMEYLATPPLIGEQSGAFSSYDRKSSYNAATDTYVQWGANGDGSGYIRKEGTDMVVFEKDGPGVIWRFWSALAKEGHIKIYLDHSRTPVVDKSFKSFFEEFGNDTPPMNLPNMVMTLSRGRNHWLPIPYNKHCKIVLSENWGAYYHITYSSFQNMSLPKFTGKFTKEESFALAKADRFLGNRGYDRKRYDGENTEEVTVTIKAGATVRVKDLTGNRAITYLGLRSDALNDTHLKDNFAKDLWLSMAWDGETKPSVEAPIGMFFGSGGANPYRSLPSGLVGNTFYSNWFMPFAKNAVITLSNKGKTDYEVSMIITTTDLSQNANGLMRFHALWHDDALYSEKPAGIKRKDITVEDFEKNSYKGWTVTGVAFGKGPASGAYSNQTKFYGYKGKELVNSYSLGDSATGTMRSRSFTINRKYLNFLVGGGAHEGRTAVNLLIDGKVALTATGADNEELFWVSWDLGKYEGKKGQIEIVDNETGGFGHINVDEIILSDSNMTRTDGRSLDWTLMKLQGKGRFCGVTLHVDNRWQEPAELADEWWYGKWDRKTIDWWWGEGDEKFFIDGEKFPSTFGTGSEDYVGYAWSAEPPFPLFDSPFASQPTTPINGNGYTVVNRFHIADNIPFQKSFEGVIEKYKSNTWGEANTCRYDVVTYWYQLPN